MDTETTISSTEARQHFAELIDKVGNAGVRYTLTVNGKPKVVMINAQEYEAWMETLEIMSNPKLAARIQRANREFQAGEYGTLDDVAGELGL